jgi:hypothetical protein
MLPIIANPFLQFLVFFLHVANLLAVLSYGTLCSSQSTLIALVFFRERELLGCAERALV